MTEEEIIYRCSKDDRKAQQQLYNIYSGKVMGICKRYMRDYERAEEVVMNTFLLVYKNINKYRKEGSFEGWLLKTAVNSCLMELRKKNHLDFSVPIEDLQLASDEILTDRIDNYDIEIMLKMLPDGAGIVFNLYVIEGYKHNEIAKLLGISEGTSKSQLYYAKEKLKKLFFTTKHNKSDYAR